MDSEVEVHKNNGILTFCIAVIITLYGFLALYGLLDTWLHIDAMISKISMGSEISQERSDMLRLMIYTCLGSMLTCLGSMLGASMVSLKGLHRYMPASQKNSTPLISALIYLVHWLQFY